MRRRTMVAGLALVMSATACNSFLSEPDAIRDPNNPSTATRNQLLAGIEAQMMNQQEGGVAMIVCQWMQQCAGVAGRFVEVQGKYVISDAPAAVTKVSDAMPGLGIVAAVLGVVITMGKLSQGKDVIGHSVGAALVGTFLGILMSYGFLGPLAARMEANIVDCWHALLL